MSSEQAQSPSERIGTTLFVAVLAHGIVILGVTFGSLSSTREERVPSLKVTLLVDRAEPVEAPQEAVWIAQRDATAAGGAAEGLRPTSALASSQPLTQLGDPAGADHADGVPREPEPSAEQLVTRSREALPLDAVFDVATDPAPVPSRAAALLDSAVADGVAAEVDLRTQLPRDTQTETGEPSPATRESVLAAYLDSWRRHVERIGTANFPRLPPRSSELGRPTLEVAIDFDGRLRDIVVRDSSGDPALDQAALYILRMAAPFEPLPPLLRAEYDSLRFAYEWDFGTDANLTALE
jgi:protein TonB